MKTLEPKITNWEKVEWRHTTQWSSPQTVRAGDMENFGPDGPPDDLARQPPDMFRTKPVLYVPIPRRRGHDHYPQVSLTVRLEVLGHDASALSRFDGSKVELELQNVWSGDPTANSRIPLPLGELKDGACTVKFSEQTLKSWLDVEDGGLQARLNENLLDLHFRIAGMAVKGGVFQGWSSNRLFLYRRRNILFYPGVFGSQVQFQDDNGEWVGFPHWERPQGLLEMDAGKLYSYMQRLIHQELGVLECDDTGVPLVKPTHSRLGLLTMAIPHEVGMPPLVADVFAQLHAAKQTWHPFLPEKFLLYRLTARPYDWRMDLTLSAQAQLEELRELQAGNLARYAVDCDDEFTLVGHSTGGLIIRRMMCEPGNEGLIGHVFFVNVPFRGAVKPSAVIPTGCDPMNGDPSKGISMIPFVKPQSLTSIALSAPIVYHLSATALAREETFRQTIDHQPQSFLGMDGVSGFVKLCIQTGFMPKRKVIPNAAGLSEEERRHLALGAHRWSHFWDERHNRERRHRLLEWIQDRADPWEQEQIEKQDLQKQSDKRVEIGWNDNLKEAATKLHSYCEQETAKNVNGWVDRSYLFFSVNEKVPTTLRMDAEREFQQPFSSLPALLKAMQIHPRAIDQPHELPREEGEGRKTLETEFFERGVWHVENVTHEDGQYIWERWRLACLQQAWGDGTVPIWSQLGFGSPVKVFKKLIRDDVEAKEAETYPRGPAHMDAPNNPWAWSCIVEVLQGHHIADQLVPLGQVDTVLGKDWDHRLNKDQPLWKKMWDKYGWLP